MISGCGEDLIRNAEMIDKNLESLVEGHDIFHNDSQNQQAPVEIQLAVALDQYLVRWVRCCILLHNFLNRRRDDWTEADGPIDLEAEPELQVQAPPTPPLDERAMIAHGRRRRLEVQSECLAYMSNANGTPPFQ